MTKHRALARQISCTLLVSLLAFSPFAASPVHAASPTTSVVIGEVAWAGSSLSSSDEWLELWNTSDAPISLAGWSLHGAGESDKTITFSATSTLPAQSAYLISNYQNTDPKNIFSVPAQLVTTAISLSNSQLRIELVDNTGMVVDSAGNGGAPPAGTNTTTVKGSMIRIASNTDGTLASSWSAATNAQNIKPGIADLGTPGICDGCRTTNASATQGANASSSSAAEVTTSPTATASTSTESSSTNVDDNGVTTTTSVTSGSDDSNQSGATTSTTSTDPTDNSTSTTSTLPITSDQPTSTSNTAGASTQTTSAPPASSSGTNSSPPGPPTPNYRMLRLSEVEPYPASGKEWIEITTLDASQPINLAGCTLSNNKQRIRTIGTAVLDPAVSRYAVIALTSARLKNDGDTLALYAPDGQPIDSMSYAQTKKGQTWIRTPDITGDWRATLTPTPGAANILTSITRTATVTPSLPTSATTSTNPTTSVNAATSTDDLVETPQANTDEPTLSQLALDGSVPLESIEMDPIIDTSGQETSTAPNDSSTTPKTKKASAKKKTTASTLKPIQPITFDMLNQDFPSTIRVRLSGRVGSLPGLLAVHTFVLQNPDGRGLLVSVPTTQRLPPFGSDVTVVGSLRISDAGIPSLKMGTKDPLIKDATTTTPIQQRIVDTLSPSAEDAWSFVSVTGTVTSVSTSIVHLDLGDGEIDLLIKPIIKYRAKRLIVGDTIRVSGLLDISKETPRITPRSADEIQLISHAPPKTPAAALTAAQPPTSTLPGWTPFAAAAGAVAVTEGTKELHKRRKIQLLEKRASALAA